MRSLFQLINRFRRDERGAFGVIFAVLGIVLIAMSGAAVDFTVIQQARTRAQVALDAAALALQPTIYTATPATIQANAQALLVNRLADAATTWGNCNSNGNQAPCAFVATPTIDTTNGQLTLSATLKISTYFVSMVGVPNMSVGVVSVSTRKKLALEVAMVLDNSGSMSTSFGTGTRMTTLISSANCAANILFYGVTTCTASTSGLTANTNVKIGIVPFTQEVNVGSGNANATWIDRTGNGNITDDNFDNDDNGTTPFTGTVDRIALFSKIKDSSGTALSWGGCVEARKSPYDTDDTTPSTASPDTLFTPLFAVDEPGAAASSGSGSNNGQSFSNSYIDDTSPTCKANPTVVWVETRLGCNKSASGGSAASNFTSATCSSTTDSYTQTDENGTVTYPTSVPSTLYNNPVPNNQASDPSDPSTVYKATKSGTKYNNTRTITYTYLQNRQLQERLCKYDSAQMAYSVSQGSVYGPNGDCPFNAITPLTNSASTITSAINALSPQGGTNITEGAAWGWRVLSPTEPFTEGGVYDSATSKVIILMTDGENTIYPGSNMNLDTYYSAYSFPYNARLVSPATSSSSTLAAEMNTRLSTVCTNAKAAGITVYTIGVATSSTSDPTGNTALLTNCASSTSDAYFPTTAADLEAAFVSIANQLSALRLEK
jgi:Flp pilus assembly protein TadG